VSKVTLTQDAKNRALRSFLQGLAIDVVVAIALVLASSFGDADGWGDLQWQILSFTLAKTAVQSIASFLMRRFVDVALPPTPQPAPATPDPAP
jgi:hypothetical protein